MNILLLSHNFYPFIGGIEVISEVLANAFTNAGHEVRVLTWATALVDDKTFRYVVIRNPNKRTLFRQHAWADVVFENNPCLRLAWPGLFFGRPSVVALHTWIAKPSGAIGIQERLKLGWWLKRARKVIAVSQALRARCWPLATVIGNPYRVDEFKVMPAVAKTDDFVFLGRLVSDKGVNLAIQAIHRLNGQNPTLGSLSENFSLTIIGDGPERKNLEQLVTELNLSSQITFTGSLSGEALVTCLNRHRFMLIPSVWEEPFGVVALEGMACGCLPIVSDGGGLPDAVGNAGLTFNRGNVKALVDRIQNILANPALERQLHHAALSHLKAHHPDTVARQYLEIIETAATNLN